MKLGRDKVQNWRNFGQLIANSSEIEQTSKTKKHICKSHSLPHVTI